MKKIGIIAPTGMLGSMMYHILKDSCKLVLIYRNETLLEKLDTMYGSVKSHTTVQIDLRNVFLENTGELYMPGKHETQLLFDALIECDMVINCSGIINRHAALDPMQTIAINSMIPHMLGLKLQDKLIHFSTDCVFDGKKKTPYSEKDTPTPSDYYGLTKMLGEPKEHSLVLRTSFIGPEIHTHSSLHDWFLSQKGKQIEGYVNHFWNGLTTKQAALSCLEIIKKRDTFPKHGLYHMYSTRISKHDLLKMLQKKYSLPVTIIPKESKFINRELDSIHPVVKQLSIPDMEKMIAAL